MDSKARTPREKTSRTQVRVFAAANQDPKQRPRRHQAWSGQTTKRLNFAEAARRSGSGAPSTQEHPCGVYLNCGLDWMTGVKGEQRMSSVERTWWKERGTVIFGAKYLGKVQYST